MEQAAYRLNPFKYHHHRHYQRTNDNHQRGELPNELSGVLDVGQNVLIAPFRVVERRATFGKETHRQGDNDHALTAEELERETPHIISSGEMVDISDHRHSG